MADWKKVVVSGSAVSQLNNDAGYLTAGTIGVPNSYSTASFNGAHLIANTTTSSLSFASSSGQGLDISANATTDTLTFGLSAIPNASLANATFNVGAGDGLTGGGSTALGGTATVNVGAGTHITANANDVAVNTSTLIAAISGSIIDIIAGDVNVDAVGVSTIQSTAVEGSMLNTNTADGSTIEVSSTTLSVLKVPNALTVDNATIQLNTGTTFDGAAARTISVKDGGIDADALASGVAGTGLSGGGGSALSVDYGSSAGDAVEGNTTITLTQTSGEIDITGTAAQALGGGPSYTIGLADTISGNRTFSNNVTIGGDMTVNGTASFANTENLLVADRFVLFASGSGAAGDGGIVVQQGTQDVGELYGFENGIGRWGFKTGFNASASAFTAQAYAGVVQVGTGQTGGSTAPIFGGSSNGHGTIHVDTDDGEIWIYS
jgi:hypothetical protein